MEKNRLLCSGRTLSESPTIPATTSGIVSARHCAVGHSTTEPMRLLSSLLPTEQIPRQRTSFFRELRSSLTAVSWGLDSSSQGYVQTGCWHVALSLCELSPPKKRHSSIPGPNCQWALLMLTPMFRLRREEMGWSLLPLQWKLFYCVKMSEL